MRSEIRIIRRGKVVKLANLSPTLTLLAAYEAAKTDLSLGRRLPLEVL